MSNYFIADIHFGHSGITNKFRTEFASQEEHNNIIHQNILSCGGKTHILWLLGDTFFKASEFWRLEEYRNAYQQVNIVLGNHCATSLPRYALQFKNVQVYGVVQKFGLWLSHVPIPDYELYRGHCIHGHLHNKKVTTKVKMDKTMTIDIPDQRYFCVSCEQVNYTPISLEEIKRIRNWA